ncbi:MAG: hypothetical protein K2N63_03910 [Lachnospiraceae bacterium]|nr:hypothetical protein [Lachnospiraceae bacterium]
MHIKTMEGIAGANRNMQLLNTPFRVFKEARRRGDTEVMKRAMGYVGECSDRADEYVAKAKEGMKEDAKEARKKAELECEKAIQNRKDEQKELEKRVEEAGKQDTDMVVVQKDGTTGQDENTSLASDSVGEKGSIEVMADTGKIKPVIYTKSGEPSLSQSSYFAGMNVSVSV